MTIEEYMACRVLGMRICVACFGPINAKNLAFHCMDCLFDLTRPVLTVGWTNNHKCDGQVACWETQIRKHFPEVFKIVMDQKQAAVYEHT